MNRCSILLALVLFLPPSMRAADPVVAGVWEGALDVGGNKLPLVFHVTSKDGKLSATMDSPNEGAKGIPVDTVEAKGGKLKLELKAIRGSYEGTFDEAGVRVKGTWKQPGGDFELTLQKVAKPTVKMRPQTPQPPFPYRNFELAVDNPKAKGVKLAGTLSVPDGKGPFPAVILISGSGPSDRDETLFRHKPFWVLADHLARAGIAVLRFDDRGVARSTGDFEKANSADFASDVEALFDHLKTRPEVDPKRIGLAGHSEGGIIAPMVAVAKPEVAFIVLMAGPGLPGAELLYLQADLIQRKMGMPEELRKWNRGLQERLFGAVKDGAKREALEKIVIEEHAKFPTKPVQKLEDMKRGSLAVDSPWFRFFLFHDPRPVLAKVKCPVLAINGELDLQVPHKENLEEIAKALKGGMNPRFEAKSFPKLNHQFQSATKGTPDEYETIEETFNAEALKAIADFVRK